MGRLKLEYIRTRDIDWFIKSGEYNIHATSCRGDLPDIVNNREYIMSSYKDVDELPTIYQLDEIAINLDFIKKRIFENLQDEELYTAIRNYLPWFVNIARKGFVTFDKTNIEDFKDNEYHIVAFPIDITDLDSRRLQKIIQIGKNENLYNYIKSFVNTISDNPETLLGDFNKCKLCHSCNTTTLNLISTFCQHQRFNNMRRLKGKISKKNVDKQDASQKGIK